MKDEEMYPSNIRIKSRHWIDSQLDENVKNIPLKEARKVSDTGDTSINKKDKTNIKTTYPSHIQIKSRHWIDSHSEEKVIHVPQEIGRNVDNTGTSNKKIKTNIDINAEDLLRILFEYIDKYFNQFGHYVPADKFENWWHRHKYGTSYQPIFQMCYILKGQELGFSVREHHAQRRITELALGIHGIKYNKETKMKSYENIDVCWGEDDYCFDSNNLILTLEYEDSGKIEDIFEELHHKLIRIDSKFTVIGTRLNSEFDVDFISKKIEEKLKKDNISKSLIFIFIAPDSLSHPSKICFSEFVYQNSELKRIDNNKYFVNIMPIRTTEGTIIEKLK